MPRRLALVLACAVAALVNCGGTALARSATSGHHRPHVTRRHRLTACRDKRRRTHHRAHGVRCTLRQRRHVPMREHPRARRHGRARRRGPIAQASSLRPSRSGRHPAPSGGWSQAAGHVETWAYDDCGDGGLSASSSLVRAWVTYAEANCGPNGVNKALGDCHSGQTVYCDVIQYLDTNWIYQTGSPTLGPFSSAASEGWYQHVPGSQTNRVQTPSNNGGWLINQANHAVQAFFAGYARSNYNSADGLMMDDQSAGLSAELYYSNCGCHTTNELASDAALRAAHEAMSAAMTHTNGQPFIQIDNALPPNPYLPQGLDMLNQSTGTQGLIAEGEPEYDGTLDPYYSTLLDQIAYVADQTTGFVVPLSYAPAGAAYQTQSRLVQEATILLGYSPGHLADWADLEKGSNDLAVWPEEGIYPTQPLQSMSTPGGPGCLQGTGQTCTTGGHNDLQVAPGVYRREFAACYDQNTPIGPCAAIVNTTPNTITITPNWLTGTYHHQITLNGGDVQTDGTINTTSQPYTPNTTTIAPKDATLLAQ